MLVGEAPPKINTKVYNKLEDNYHLANKKALFINMKNYYEGIGEDPFANLPVTFHVTQGKNDPEFERFSNYYMNFKARGLEERKDPHRDNVWIIKPGENTNKGHGI